MNSDSIVSEAHDSPSVEPAGSVPFELQLLSQAVNYQKWVAHTVTPFLGKRILEVGAGIGNMSKWLPARELLVLSEADTKLLPELKQTVAATFGGRPEVRTELVDLSTDWWRGLAKDNLDTVVSFNVLEHVEDDAKALRDLVGILRESKAAGPKRIVTFVPAHQWAYGTIDQGYGHFRRYSKARMRKLQKEVVPDAEHLTRYFNFVGLPSWVLLGRVLRRRQIGMNAVHAFEKICPYIQGIDGFLQQKLAFPFGQSLLSVITLKKN